MGILAEEATILSLVLPFLFSSGQLLKERICSQLSKFFPLKVDPMSKSYLIQTGKQTRIQAS